MRDIRRLSEIRETFDAVLIDQFGVLHDGHAAFPGARDCLMRLADAGVPVVALSNSGKRSYMNIARLERLGFPEDLFCGVITSGELAYTAIAERLESGRLAPGLKVAVISRDNDASMIEGLDIRRVAPDEGPELLIIAAAEPEIRSMDSYLAELKPLAEAGVPALCINPDRRIYANGAAAFGPGALADRYRELSGDVQMLGKPGGEMFSAGLRALGGVQPGRSLMVGDSPEHDIAGAQAAGCRTLLVSTGVQSDVDACGVVPDFRVERLVW